MEIVNAKPVCGISFWANTCYPVSEEPQKMDENET